MPITYQTLSDSNIASFTDGISESSSLHERLAGYLQTGVVRPEWCWLALSPTGNILARHYWWSRAGSDRPFGIDDVSMEDHDTAVALIAYSRGQLKMDEAFCQVTIPVEEGDDPSRVHVGLVAALRDTGFSFEVARVSVEWTVGPVTIPDSSRLTFRPVRKLDDELLCSVFQSVADNSLDHGMIAGRNRFGAEKEARDRLDTALTYPGDSDWFSVAFDSEGGPVGYVVPALIGDVSIVAEVGVVATRRGHHYVNDLLSWATRKLAESGATRIVGDTDRGNTPMRAAFKRGGYREFRWRDDYSWLRPM